MKNREQMIGHPSTKSEKRALDEALFLEMNKDFLDDNPVTTLQQVNNHKNLMESLSYQEHVDLQISQYEAFVNKFIKSEEFDKDDPSIEILGDNLKNIYAPDNKMIYSLNTHIVAEKNVSVLTRDMRLTIIDPVSLRGGRGWRIKFGFDSILFQRINGRTDISGVTESAIVLPNEVASILKSNEIGEKIIAQLKQNSYLFNHDFMSHGTTIFMFKNGTDVLGQKHKDIGDAWLENHDPRKPYQAFNRGEIWSAKVQSSYYDKVKEIRPGLDRWMVMNFKSYLNNLEKLKKDNGLKDNEELVEDVCEYMKDLYAFMFFRLIDPKRIKEGGDLEEFGLLYPNLNNLPEMERSYQELLHTDKGHFTYTDTSKDNAEIKIPNKDFLKETETILRLHNLENNIVENTPISESDFTQALAIFKNLEIPEKINFIRKLIRAREQSSSLIDYLSENLSIYEKMIEDHISQDELIKYFEENYTPVENKYSWSIDDLFDE